MVRAYCKHRANLLQQAADTSRKMQKYLRLLNLRLDVVVKDVTGLTGMTIIKAICKGEVSPEKLASFRHGNCKKSKREIAKALQSNERKDLLFALTHEYELYQIFQGKITECDIAAYFFLIILFDYWFITNILAVVYSFFKLTQS